MPFVIVDTDILIDVGHGVSDAIKCLTHLKQHSTPVISAVTQMELIVGCRNKTELQRIEKFLQPFPRRKIEKTISDQALRLLKRYRLSHGLLIPAEAKQK